MVLEPACLQTPPPVCKEQPVVALTGQPVTSAALTEVPQAQLMYCPVSVSVGPSEEEAGPAEWEAELPAAVASWQAAPAVLFSRAPVLAMDC